MNGETWAVGYLGGMPITRGRYMVRLDPYPSNQLSRYPGTFLQLDLELFPERIDGRSEEELLRERVAELEEEVERWRDAALEHG